MRRKIYPRSIYTTLSDKFKVREFIAGLWGEEYLVELYAHGTELSYDMFRQLPNAFVLKANHGSGYNRLVFDKRQVSYAELYDLSNAWMRSNFYEQSRESIIWISNPASWWSACCWMASRCRTISSFIVSTTIMKFACSSVDYQRFGTHRRDIFDIDWNRTEIRISLPNADEPMPRPTRLDEMTRLARQQRSSSLMSAWISTVSARRCISVS